MARKLWLEGIALSWLTLLGSASAGDTADARVAVAQQPTQPRLRLKEAIREAETTPGTAADGALNAAIDAADSASVDPADWHVALAVSAHSALRLNAPERALQRARQATALPDQSIDDWRLRLRAASLLHQARDEVLSITAIGHRWGYALKDEPESLIFQAAREGIDAGLEEEVTAMLRTLFEVRWHAEPGDDASILWRELALRLTGQGQLVEAVDVAAHVSEPYILLSMYADRRFDPVIHAHLAQGNVPKATGAWVERLREQIHQRSQLLEPVVRLAGVLLANGRPKEVLSLTDEALRRIETPASGEPVFNDADQELSWLYGVRANAFERLGRFSDALAAKQQSVMAAKGSTLTHQLNLAELYCRLNRPDDALAALPAAEHGGRSDPAFVAWIQLAAADERGDAAEVNRALRVLQTYEAERPRLLQRALVVAGRFDAAAALYLRRLNDSSARRSDALSELQKFIPSTAPPQVLKWRAAFDTVRARPDVQAAVRRVGRVSSYPLEGLIP